MSSSKGQWSAYQPQDFEPKWQKLWNEGDLYQAQENGDKPKYYCLDFFPYPSGEGLHVGHCRNYIPTDVVSRYKRMKGFNVLHPMGWDAFGEPAEQYAIAHGVHPRLTTDRNTANFQRQMKLIGTSYDWSREIDSSKPEFYRWTQDFFLLLYNKGLAYRDLNWQWWCPVCQTTLSSHEVNHGVCWRGHTGVTRREIPAWYFRITAYADELLAGLEEIDWPDNIKTMQRNWIGRSEGCEVIFQATNGATIPVFTTRPDTLYGVTFLALAPEHALVDKLTTQENQAMLTAYRDQAAQRSEVERMIETREKTGVFTGSYVSHPLSKAHLPVWVADYVLPTYGTGAIMGVPAHDQRDFEFAKNYNLPVQVVILPVGQESPANDQVYTGSGLMINSGPFSGLSSQAGAERIIVHLDASGFGGAKVNYRMRDWLISRQRYWGTPIPIIYCPEHGELPVPQEDLPVYLPMMDDFQPDGSGRSALARSKEFFVTACPICGRPAQRETDTMGGFACSSWYFLRFTSPWETGRAFDPQAVQYWMPVDLYVGGAEHAVLHLLYARFWTRALADMGVLDFREPFAKLLNQGQLLAPDGNRMSKSRGNVITPDHIVEKYGSDALRVYELFMAPFDQDVSWSTEGINGAQRFLRRIWNLYSETYTITAQYKTMDDELERITHKTINAVSERIENLRLNTVVSTIMEFLNQLTEKQQNNTWRSASFHKALDALLLILAPIAPHITEEIWQRTGHFGSVHAQEWPAWNPELLKDNLFDLPIQIDGRLRDVIQVSEVDEPQAIQEFALAQPKVKATLEGKKIKKVVYIQGKILNIVLER